MTLKIQENSIDLEELKRSLSEEFEDTYNVFKRGKAEVIVAKDKNIGTIVTLTKNKVYVVGNFPEKWKAILFILLVIALGVLIPLIFYYIFYNTKMKAVEKEVGDFLKEHFSNKLRYQ